MAEQGRLARKAAAGTGAALGATVLFAPAADAATFTVTSLADDGSEGTLRKEINDAVAAAGDDTIVFQSGLTGTIQLQNTSDAEDAVNLAVGDIEIYGDSLEIQGPGAGSLTIRGGGSDRLFELTDGNGLNDSVVFSGLTLTNGRGDAVGKSGGAISTDIDGDAPNGGPNALDVVIRDSVITGNRGGEGGALYSFYGAFTIERSTISDNIALYNGGGVYLQKANRNGTAPASLTITDSTVSGNTAGVSPGGLYQGGGIYNGEPYGDTVIRNSVVSGNSADGNGGGAKLYSDDTSTGGDDTDITIVNSTFSANTAGADGYGGGLVLYGHDEVNSVTISGSTFSGNSAGAGGGGAKLWGTGAPLLIENSTFTGNTAGDQSSNYDGGGGISSYNPEDLPRTIRNSTIVGNTAGAAEGGGIARHPLDNASYAGPDVLTLRSTIVSGNTAATGPDLGDQVGPVTSGSFDVGLSLIGSTSGATVTENPAGSNLIGVDPLLGPLADNGGPTQTHLPGATSPAIDAGVANGLTTDQRGLPRTFDDAVADRAGSDGTDIGAVEAIPACKGLLPTIVSSNGVATGTAAADVIVGTHRKDKISGGGGADTICAGGGNDKVNAGGGKDFVRGEAGKDNLKGGGGADKLKGNDGKDTLKGGGGKDKLNGGAGKDKLKGGAGKDKLNGGPGRDQETQ